jgi:hypothetical protein
MNEFGYLRGNFFGLFQRFFLEVNVSFHFFKVLQYCSAAVLKLTATRQNSITAAQQ